MLVVFVQLEPTKVDVDSEVVAVWKIGDCCFGRFETLEKKFVRVDKVPTCALEGLAIVITIAASRNPILARQWGFDFVILDLLLVFSLSITLKGFNYQLEVKQDTVKCLEDIPIVISHEILILEKEWLLRALFDVASLCQIVFVPLA
jgi:hypothetical protein